MKLSDAPYLPAMNKGVALRKEAAKLATYAMLNMRNGGDFPKLFGSFWEDMLVLSENDTGKPSDGIYLGHGLHDLRKECYDVLSYIRMSPRREEDLGKFKAFCTFFKEYSNDLITESTDKPEVVNGAVTE